MQEKPYEWHYKKALRKLIIFYSASSLNKIEISDFIEQQEDNIKNYN